MNGQATQAHQHPTQQINLEVARNLLVYKES